MRHIIPSDSKFGVKVLRVQTGVIEVLLIIHVCVFFLIHVKPCHTAIIVLTKRQSFINVFASVYC